jgi:hypothetical protein
VSEGGAVAPEVELVLEVVLTVFVLGPSGDEYVKVQFVAGVEFRELKENRRVGS